MFIVVVVVVVLQLGQKLRVRKPGSFARKEGRVGLGSSHTAVHLQPLLRSCLAATDARQAQVQDACLPALGQASWHLGQSLSLWTPAQDNGAGFSSHEAPLRVELGEAVHYSHLESSGEYDTEIQEPRRVGGAPLPYGAELVCFMRALKADMLLGGGR